MCSLYLFDDLHLSRIFYRISQLHLLWHKLFLWFKIRALEATIDGRSAIIELVKDPVTLANMEQAQLLCHLELRKLRWEYRQ